MIIKIIKGIIEVFNKKTISISMIELSKDMVEI